VDISIDGFGETHDRIRGVPGNFEKALDTLSELEALRSQWPHLTLYVNSVITQENQNQIVDLGRYFQKNTNLDGHYFQIIRGDPKDPSLQTVAPQKLKEIYDEVQPLNFAYISKPPQRKSFLDSARGAYWRAGYIFSYETQYRNYVSKANWKMPCTAGQTSIVIDYNGDVRVCELRKPIGNLRKYGMDFMRFWDSVDREREVRQVALDKCFCTHICFMYDSMRHSKRVMLWELPKRYLKHSLRGLFNASQKPSQLQATQVKLLRLAPGPYAEKTRPERRRIPA
jgi:MoaA/NifB/PqqE/SkfB family radical SAM enzyme